ncbi:MAG: hypothetical protein HYV27_01245 [Candidatus Hydrogenedentes bacterium]|nr:hypothetical protein [Candidatus Hydrogenedentota bacterium]
MRRIQIAKLHPGVVLRHSLYDDKYTLLLAPGKQLTHEMVLSLRNTGHEYAYLGTEGADGKNVMELRAEAEKLSDEILAEFDKLLTKEDLEPKPQGPSMLDQILSQLKVNRDAKSIDELMTVCENADNFVEDIAQGWIHEDEVGQAALATANSFASALMHDPSMVSLLAQAKRSDTYLFKHSVNVSLLGMQVTAALGYGREQVVQAGVASLLQDLGMAMVPKDIAGKQEKLGPIEMIDIHKHTSHSMYLIERFKGVQLIPRFVAMQCHERADGSGYPRRRPKRLIHVFARIVSVVDIYDSLISERPWRAAHHPYDALEILIRGASRGLYDADAVRGLLQVLSLYPIGTYVRLNTGEVGRVVHPNGSQFGRPVVCVTLDNHGKAVRGPIHHDLSKKTELSVTEIMRQAPEQGVFAGF